MLLTADRCKIVNKCPKPPVHLTLNISFKNVLVNSKRLKEHREILINIIILPIAILNMTSIKLKYFVLTGEPGVGKTTLTKKIASILATKHIKVSGFYTEEVRRNGIREGFDIVTMDGVRGRLARDQNLIKGPVKYKVGKYGVLIDEFENIALQSLIKPTAHQSHVLVIDEIGKMEFFSEPFKAAIRKIFNPTSDFVVLATIPMRRSDQLIESIRNHGQGKVWLVTRENRNNIHEDILKEINTTLGVV